MMTWLSYLARSLSLILVVPLLTSRFEPAEISMWYLFTTVIALQHIIDMGFASTFVRVISYAMGGAEIDEIDQIEEAKIERSKKDANWESIDKIFCCMLSIYNKMIFFVILVLGILSAFMIIPINKTSSIMESWAAWGVVCIGMVVIIRGSIYATYIQGLNEVALLKKWDAVFGFCQVVSNTLVLVLEGNLLMLVTSHIFWYAATVPRNWLLSLNLADGVMRDFKLESKFNKIIFEAVWSSAWRSGLGSLMVMGVTRLSNIIYAQIGSSTQVAVYLMSYDLLKQLSRFSQAPVYSKLPLLARLRYEGAIEKLKSTVSRGMVYCFWIFTAGSIAGYFVLPILLEFADSNITLAEPMLWYLIGMSMLLERYVGIHTQIYTTTNHIVWHITSGTAGALFILYAISGFYFMGIYAFPLAIILSNLSFSAWYIARLSYQSLNTTFLEFENKVSIPVFSFYTLILVYFLIW